MPWHRQLWWDAGRSPWIEDFDDCLAPVWEASVALAGEHPNITKRWREQLAGADRFAPFAVSSIEFVDVLARDEFVSLVASFGWLEVLPAADRDAALAAVRDVVAPLGEPRLAYRTDFEYARVRDA